MAFHSSRSSAHGRSLESRRQEFQGSFPKGWRSFQVHLRRVFYFTNSNCLNSRPIAPQSQDPSDLSALTPGHFLTGGPILAPVDPLTTETPLSVVNRWQRLKVLHRDFCLRWKREYLCELQKRTKWQNSQPNVQLNDLVVIKEENLPPNSWRLGRIINMHLGRDNRVRVVDRTRHYHQTYHKID